MFIYIATIYQKKYSKSKQIHNPSFAQIRYNGSYGAEWHQIIYTINFIEFTREFIIDVWLLE